MAKCSHCDGLGGMEGRWTCKVCGGDGYMPATPQDPSPKGKAILEAFQKSVADEVAGHVAAGRLPPTPGPEGNIKTFMLSETGPERDAEFRAREIAFRIQPTPTLPEFPMEYAAILLIASALAAERVRALEDAAKLVETSRSFPPARNALSLPDLIRALKERP